MIWKCTRMPFVCHPITDCHCSTFLLTHIPVTANNTVMRKPLILLQWAWWKVIHLLWILFIVVLWKIFTISQLFMLSLCKKLLPRSSHRRGFCIPSQVHRFTLPVQMFLDSLPVFILNGLGMLIETLFLVKLWQQVNPGLCRVMSNSRDNDLDLILSGLEENV